MGCDGYGQKHYQNSKRKIIAVFFLLKIRQCLSEGEQIVLHILETVSSDFKSIDFRALIIDIGFRNT